MNSAGTRAFLLGPLAFTVASPDWIFSAPTIAVSSPGKRLSISVQRDVFCISTPTRSERISPASRRALKCCDSVDFGIAFSLTVRKFEQFVAQLESAIRAKMATRVGSDNA